MLFGTQITLLMFRSFIIFLFFTISLSECTNEFPIQTAVKTENKDAGANDDKLPKKSSEEKIPEIHLGSDDNVQRIHLDVSSGNKKITEKPVPVPSATPTPTNKTTAATPKKPTIQINGNEMESGAFVRGLLVFVALSMLFLIYLGYKTYRGRTHKAVMVRKYGVRTPRNDVEMTPLPLDEDEEDETLFDVGSVNR